METNGTDYIVQISVINLKLGTSAISLRMLPEGFELDNLDEQIGLTACDLIGSRPDWSS